MRNFLTLLAVLLVGFSGAAQAKTRTPPHSKPAGVESHVWQNFGVAPYATTEKECMSPEKVKAFFKIAVEGRVQMPQDVADILMKDIAANPKGRQNGEWAYLTVGTHFDLMMSKTSPMYNVTVGEKLSSHGVAGSIRARQWSAQVGETIWVISNPEVCCNWSVTKVAAQAPPQGEACAVINLETAAGNGTTTGDRGIVWVRFGNFNPNTVCTGYREKGQLKWHPMPVHCLGNGPCDLSPITREVNMELIQSGGWQTRPGATYEVLVPKRDAQSHTTMYVFCIKRWNYALDPNYIMVRFDDYHDWQATVYRTLGGVPENYPYRKLYWPAKFDANLSDFGRK